MITSISYGFLMYPKEVRTGRNIFIAPDSWIVSQLCYDLVGVEFHFICHEIKPNHFPSHGGSKVSALVFSSWQFYLVFKIIPTNITTLRFWKSAKVMKCNVYTTFVYKEYK